MREEGRPGELETALRRAVSVRVSVSGLGNPLGGAFGDHDRGRVGIAANQCRHDRGDAAREKSTDEREIN